MAIQGDLREMGLSALVQWGCQEGARARLSIQRGDAQAFLYLAEGNVAHALLHPGEGADSLEGEEALYRILDWEEGAFTLETDLDPPVQTITSPWSALLLRAMQLRDERQWEMQLAEQTTRRDNMASRTTTDILKDMLDVPGITTAVVVGRDGFVIEAAGSAKAVNLDALGASLAHAINAIELMGKELQIRAFKDLFVEHEGALIIARPVGDAIIALVAPDASQLGTVRYRIKPLVEELGRFF
jgi:predicted regulator of Ras-like GTPase activity (Roadblock/LC7/MglB family)